MASTPAPSIPRAIKVGGKTKRWVTGSFIGNFAAAAKRAEELRAEHRAGNFSRVPEGATVRRIGCDISVYA